MSVEVLHQFSGGLPVDKRALFRTISIMGVSAIILSAAVIAYFNGLVSHDIWSDVFGKMELVVASLMPYMISAVIAAITATAIIAILPFFKVLSLLARIHHRLELLSAGDLCSKIPAGKGQFGEVAMTLNDAVDSMASRISQLKGINRRQWDLLETIRISAQRDSCSAVLQIVDEMEENWSKLAKIESQLVT